MKIKQLIIVLFSIISLLSFTYDWKANGTAYAITWQNSAGWWFAVGPLQATSAGEKLEEVALDFVIGSKARKANSMKFIGDCGKFKVYNLGVEYESYDLDAINYVSKYKGYNCNWP